jgi:hypothetical protein
VSPVSRRRSPRWSRGASRLAGLLVVALTVGALAAPAGAKATPSPADKVLLNAGVITAADVPAGWTATSQADTSADQFKGVAHCAAVYRAVFDARATVPYKLSKAFSPPGADNGITSVDDTVLAFKNAARASRFVAVFQDARAGPCLQAVLAKALRGEGHAVVAPLTVAPVGDATVGYEASITSTSPGLTGPQVGDIVVLRVGRVVAYVTTLNAAAAPLPQGPALLAAIAARLRQAGA